MAKKRIQQNSQWQKISRELLAWAVLINFYVVELYGFFTGSLDPWLVFLISAFLLTCAFYPKMVPSFLTLISHLRSLVK